MSNSILGNNGQYTISMTEWETEVGDDEYEELEGELIDEGSITGYRAVCPKNSETTSVTIGFYYKAPTSEWYWDYMYGVPYEPIIPLVFSCDSSWNLSEALNQSYFQIVLDGRSDGWITMAVTLKRKLVKDEKIFFGVYSERLGIVSSDYASNGSMSYYYWSNERRRNYNSDIAYVSSSAFITKATSGASDYEACVYMQYENEIESVAYTRTVLGNVGAVSVNTRKSNWKRTLPITEVVSEENTRKTKWIRNTASNGGLSVIASRFNYLFRSRSDSKKITDSSNKTVFFSRKLERQEGITARNFRSNRMYIAQSDQFFFGDSLQQLLMIIRSVFSGGDALDILQHKSDYRRVPESVVDDEEIVIRSGDNFRGFIEEIELEALPFASRLFFRAVATVMTVWDWLRGKIREANNVVSFFCPVDLEIQVTCKI